MAIGDTPGYRGPQNPEVLDEGYDRYILVYNGTGSAVSDGDNFFLGCSSTYGLQLEAVANVAVKRELIVVCNTRLGLATIASGAYGFVQKRGYCLKVSTAAILVDRFIGGGNAVKVANDEGATQTVNSFGITMAAAVAGYAPAMLFGFPVVTGQ